MNLSEYGFAKLQQWEGLRLNAYQDAAGVWTLGYGHTQGVKEGDACNDKQANLWLRSDVIGSENCVRKSVKVELTQHQFDALVSFVFNCGCAAFKSSTLLKKLNRGEYEAVPAEFMKWVKITDPRTKQKRVSKGLSNRRAAELGLWAKGTQVASAAKVAEPKGSGFAGAMKTGTASGAITVTSAVSAAGAFLAAVSPHLEMVEKNLYAAPLTMALIAVVALAGVIIWRAKRN